MDLRSQLMNVDGFERTQQRELLDLKGGAEAEPEVLAGAEGGQGMGSVSLAHLARASAFAAAQARSAVENAAAAASAQQEAEVAAPAQDEDWMQAELAALQAEVDGAAELEADEEAYLDPGADSFFASLEDIENLEQGGDLGDPGADAFVASLEDIAHLVPEAGAEATAPVSDPAREEPSPLVSAEPEPRPVGLPFDDEG
jgi:hypothetical protein